MQRDVAPAAAICVRCTRTLNSLLAPQNSKHECFQVKVLIRPSEFRVSLRVYFSDRFPLISEAALGYGWYFLTFLSIPSIQLKWDRCSVNTR